MADQPPNPELLNSLGRLVRGLSALFWGLPIALVVCVQTAKGDWFRPLGVLPPMIATGLLVYGLHLLESFQKQERVWRTALDWIKIIAYINLGLSPFLYWWNRIPSQVFFQAMVYLLMAGSLGFLLALNPLLSRLAAMLPDETLRLETKLFTTLNRALLIVTCIVLGAYFALERISTLPQFVIHVLYLLDRVGIWLTLFFILLPLAMTMALIWKIKEVILAGVFGPER